MSFKTVQQNSAEKTDTFSVPAGIAARGPTGWVRNPSWPALPSITSSDEKIVGLYAVYPDSTFAAMTITCTGGYTVNWGDGTTTNYTSATQANYQYDFNDVDLANTNAPVTFQDSGDTVTRTAHGYTNGMTISFSSITTTTGISAGQIYYVINATANTFQLASTPGGSALALTNNGTGIILPYKIATITVTSTTGVNTITSISLQVKNSTTGLQSYSMGWLDLSIASSATTISLGGATVPPGLLEQCSILRSAVTTFANLFQNCYKLQSIPTLSTSGTVTNTGSMFANCTALTTAPLFNTASASTMSSMFSGCTSLVSVPLYNTSSATTMSSMFAGCTALQTVPLFNTANVTNMSSMFASANQASSLISVPLFNTASVTLMTSMFLNCTALTTVPLFNTASVTDMSGMFSGCSSLQSVPAFNTASATLMGSASSTGGMFFGCTSLTSVPLFNTANVTNMGNMFRSCASLQSVPLYNTVNVTRMDNMFNGCTSLQTVPAFDTSAVTGTTAFTTMFSGCSNLQSIPDINFGRAAITTNASYTNMFQNCSSLSSIGTTAGPKFTFSVTSCKLSPAALDALYTSLPTVTAQTITVTNNWGNASDTPSIATAKGWTVTG